MVIATRLRHEPSPLHLQPTPEKTRIEQVREHRVVGVIIDDEMKWQSYLTNLCKTVSKNVFHFLNSDTT